MKLTLAVLAVSVIVFSSVQCSQGQLVKAGGCPKVQVKQDMDLDRYLGTWYQYATFGTRLFQGEGRCVTARYTYNETSGLVDVLNTQVPKSGTFPAMSSIKGTVEPADKSSHEGKFVVTFPAPVIKKIRAPYWVINTDYVFYAVVYSCVDAGLAHTLSGWILTREQDLSHETKAALEEAVAGVLAGAGLQRSWFQTTDQSNCDDSTSGQGH